MPERRSVLLPAVLAWAVAMFGLTTLVVDAGRHNCKPVWKCPTATPGPTATASPRASATQLATGTPTATNAAPSLHLTPAPPTPPVGVYGPAIAADGKDNRWIGMNLSGATPREVAHRWPSAGGQMIEYAYNQRSGTGYSMGDGGTVELSLYRCDPLPTGPALSTVTHRPGNPGGEVKTPIPWAATVPVGQVCITHRNIASPGNFISANELWHPDPDSPRQPAFPLDDMAVLSRGEFSSGWSVVRQNTPVFDVTYSNGTHEGQAYHERFISPQEIVTVPTDKVRERFTPTAAASVEAACLRVNRRSGATLFASLAGQTASTSMAHVPVEVFQSTVWVGGKWTCVPLSATLPAGVEQSVVFWTDGSIRVAPIRQTIGWGSRQFTDGVAEKSLAGGAWQQMYFDGVADLQFYLVTD